MKPEIPVEILSLHPKLRLPLKFGCDKDQIFAELSDSGKRFPLTEWQLELLMGMDGIRSFGSLIDELEFRSKTKLDAKSLRSFYTWLYAENLISTIAQTPSADESVFELVMDEGEGREVIPDKVISFPKMRISNWDQVIKAACYAVTILGVIRIAWLVAPAFEPALQRVHVDIAGFFQEDDNAASPVIATTSTVTAERTVQATKIEYISVAGKQDQMKSLREQLAACRIRRDEYYLQNDESSYRTEVEMITRLTRKIGELELAD